MDDNEISSLLAEAETPFSYDDYETPDLEAITSNEDIPEHENLFLSEPIGDFRDGLEQVNMDFDTYSFNDFVEAYSDALIEPGGEEKMFNAFIDYAVDVGADNITPDLTYSLAYFDESGFCNGLDKIEDALIENGMSPEDAEKVISSAIEHYCDDPIVNFQSEGSVITFEIPIREDIEIKINDVEYTAEKGNIEIVIDFESGHSTTTIWNEQGNPFEIDATRGETAEFVCDVLGGIYGENVGVLASDVYEMVMERESLEIGDEDIVANKICDHIEDFIDARSISKEEKEDFEVKLADMIENEICSSTNDVDVNEEDADRIETFSFDEDDEADFLDS